MPPRIFGLEPPLHNHRQFHRHRHLYLLFTLSASEANQKADTSNSHLLTIRFVFTLAELVWIVIGVVCLRSKFRGQFKYRDSHLPRLQMQQTGFVRHAAEIIRQERREPREAELGAPDIGRYFNETRHLNEQPDTIRHDYINSLGRGLMYQTLQ